MLNTADQHANANDAIAGNHLTRSKRFVDPLQAFSNVALAASRLFGSDNGLGYDEASFNGYGQNRQAFSEYDTQPLREPLNFFNELAARGAYLPPAHYSPQPIYQQNGRGAFVSQQHQRVLFKRSVPIAITSENNFVAEGDHSSTTTKPALIQYSPTLQVHPSDLQIRYNKDEGKIRVKRFLFDKGEPYYDDPYARDEFDLTFLKPF